MSDRFDEMARNLFGATLTGAGVSAFADVLRTVAQEERRKALEQAAVIAEDQAAHCGFFRHGDAQTADEISRIIRALIDQPTPGETK